ncbi:hypothetical protein JZ751_019036 [Albula glossodonta]|uniref:Uncharacterized protein n=1 Tax=Albula glossodonta TaxID=121402 RepID=A0A8T2NQZ7_9TELE|nr:hypothetical protein JZ751_019036 [Albula glossodonta]
MGEGREGVIGSCLPEAFRVIAKLKEEKKQQKFIFPPAARSSIRNEGWWYWGGHGLSRPPLPRFQNSPTKEPPRGATSPKFTQVEGEGTLTLPLGRALAIIEPNPFLNSTLEADALLRSPVPPVPSKDQGRLSSSGRGLPPLPFPPELVPFDEALRDVNAGRPLGGAHDSAATADIVARHGAQLLEIKAAERREMEKQMKIENLFVTWQQRSAQSNMPITVSTPQSSRTSKNTQAREDHGTVCHTPKLF